MARKKKSMIGFDPLAWLDGDEDKAVTAGEEMEPVALPEKDSKKRKSVVITVLGHSVDETALLKGYKLAMEKLDEVAADFYDELFTQYPAVKPLFENTSENAQASKLVGALKILVDNLHNESELKNILSALGERHQVYGALPDHYPVVAELLVASFKNKIGRSWTKAISAAWIELLVAAAETMCAAYKDDIEIDSHIDAEESTEDAFMESTHPVLQLNSIQDISKSQVLKNDMLTLINDNDEIDIYAADVERIDGSALQLLCALFTYANQNNLVINWIEPSDVLKQSAQTLGVQKILDLS